MINEGAPYWEIRDERNIYIQIEPIKVDAAKRTSKRRNMDYSFCHTFECTYFEVHLKFMKSTFKSANESFNVLHFLQRTPILMWFRASKDPIYFQTRVRVKTGPNGTGPGPDPGPEN